LLLHEKRAHLSLLNAIGELCAQFRPGILAAIRNLGAEQAIETVEQYHQRDRQAGSSCWFPDTFAAIGQPSWQQLYVNAEHDGKVGVISIGRESYNAHVDAELNRAIDWLVAAGIQSAIVTGDFHLSTQMVGADTSDFYPAMENQEFGTRLSSDWSRTARRLETAFRTSVAFVHGKRCLGGCLELLVHCHYLVAVEDAQFGMPEVTLPVVPGMEGCHWTFRKAAKSDWPKLVQMLLTGRPVRATEAQGWLCDLAAPLEQALATAWQVASGGDHRLSRRKVETGALQGVPAAVAGLPAADGQAQETARQAIMAAVQASCSVPLADALAVQARHSGAFMVTEACLGGVVGADFQKTMKV
ncbi:MAG: enoyl-CoA hydratase/isomerase family protein, partial [Planctomycetes bacterium]|nr:enoyl-CoA hydratase/isomerase family protein [Planctomycetota bacterium]